MKYFRIGFCLDSKVIGEFPQLEPATIPGFDFQSSLGSKGSYDKAPDDTIQIPFAKLHRRAKLTDVFSVAFMGHGLFVSEKMKELVEKSNQQGVIFIKSGLVLNGIINPKFWILFPQVNDFRFLDVENSEFCYLNLESNEVIKHDSFNTIEEFFEAYKEDRALMMRQDISWKKKHLLRTEKIAFKEDCELDFFSFTTVKQGGTAFYISEKFKEHLENAVITGMSFYDLNINP
jgi:hypothetical protein